MSRTAARALDLLERVAALPEPAGLLELASATGLDKSTAARLLAFLSARELVARDNDTRRYAPGPALVALGAGVLRRSSLRSIARPHLERLRDATEETATLHVHVGDRVVCIDGAESRHAIRRAIPLGEALPLGVGVTGKAILAQFRREEIEATVGPAELRGMRSQLAAAASDGWLAAVGDRVSGVSAIAVPVVTRGRPHGAVTIAGPAERWTTELMHEHAPLLREAVKRIAGALEASTATA
jgi:DNA-binding IclR family transcriptional regulator